MSMEPNRLEIMWGTPILDEGFTSIPNLIIRNASKVGLTGREFQFVCVLLTYKHDTNDPYPSQQTLGEHLGVKRHQITKLINSLLDKGLIEVGQRLDDRNQYKSNVYNFKPLVDKCLQLVGESRLPDPKPNGKIAWRKNKPCNQKVNTPSDQKVNTGSQPNGNTGSGQKVNTKITSENDNIENKNNKTINLSNELNSLDLPIKLKQVLKQNQDRLTDDSINLTEIELFYHSSANNLNDFDFATVVNTVLTKTKDPIYNITSILKRACDQYYLDVILPNQSEEQELITLTDIPENHWLRN